METWIVCVLLLSAALTWIGSKSQDCGVAPLNTRVVGGTGAAAGSWPWQVSMHIRGFHICGGTVINNQWVLTAAHCILVSTASSYTLYFGRDTQAGPNPNEVSRRVSRIIIHPNYNDTVFNNDIALMQLTDPINFNNFIRPVCLASRSSTFHNATSCWATGWGNTAEGESLPANSSLQEVRIPVIGNNQCSCAYIPAPEANITGMMMCAGELNKGICQGDSGGPLQCQQNSTWIQAGIASFGVPCAVGFPEAYTRVSQFDDWIAQQVGGANVSFVTFNSTGTDPDSTFSCRSKSVRNAGQFGTELALVAFLVTWLQQNLSIL